LIWLLEIDIAKEPLKAIAINAELHNDKLVMGLSAGWSPVTSIPSLGYDRIKNLT